MVNPNALIIPRLAGMGNVLFFSTALLNSLSAFGVFTPWMPASDLDPSWCLGLNQAVAQGLVFGRDIVFTFGPYASVHTRLYHPATDTMMLLGSLYLGLSFWGCFTFLLQNRKWLWKLAGCFIPPLLEVYSRDALLFSYPLLAGIAGHRLAVLTSARQKKKVLHALSLAGIFAPFGLLVLTKGTVFILCAAVLALFSLYSWQGGRIADAVVSLGTFCLVMVVLWLVVGQPAKALPAYVSSLFRITSGYSEAMAFPGDPTDIVLFGLTAASILTSALRVKEMPAVSKAYLGCLFAVFLFISFKAGFVRHDLHALAAGGSVLVAAFCLPIVTGALTPPLAFVLSIATWGYIGSHWPGRFNELVDIRRVYALAWDGLGLRLHDQLPNNYQAALREIQKQAGWPTMPGTSDVYSYGQAFLIASGNRWAPRPVMQSYSAYTAELAEENARHLASDRAPENIFFKIETIDNRLPSGDDGASWVQLLASYQPKHIIKDYLLLQKRENAQPSELTLLASGTYKLGEEVAVPGAEQLVFARIEVKPTLFGRLAGFFFKRQPLKIELQLTNGEVRKYRLISGAAKAGLLFSPLIETTSDFALLYSQDIDLAEKRVRSFTIKARAKRQWQRRYSVAFFRLKKRLIGKYPSNLDSSKSCYD